MEEEKRVQELEKKVQELEELRNQCSLTDDIKQLLVKCIESNEKFKNEIKNILIKEKDTNWKNLTNVLIEYKWIFLIIVVTYIVVNKV